MCIDEINAKRQQAEEKNYQLKEAINRIKYDGAARIFMNTR